MIYTSTEGQTDLPRYFKPVFDKIKKGYSAFQRYIFNSGIHKHRQLAFVIYFNVHGELLIWDPFVYADQKIF